MPTTVLPTTLPVQAAQANRSYLAVLEQRIIAAFPEDFPIYLGEDNAPNQDIPPRVVWFPLIGEIKEASSGAYRDTELEVYREVVAERQLNFAFQIWAEDFISADLLVSAVYARVSRVVPKITRAQEQWQSDDQQTTLGKLVTLLISIPVPLADDDLETTEVLASVVAQVRMRTEPVPVTDNL
jgi:hypothetical protein